MSKVPSSSSYTISENDVKGPFLENAGENGGHESLKALTYPVPEAIAKIFI